MPKFLFIGNSHTYFNDMVYMFARLCKANGQETHVTMLTSPGKSLLWHSEETDVRFNILYGGYDYIILQDVAHPFAGEDALLEGVEKIKTFTDKTNAKIVLFMTWAEKRFPENQVKMSEAYRFVAQRVHALVAPVGEHWQEVRQAFPQIELYASDGEHASPFGSYLVSETIYRTVFGAYPNCIDQSLQQELGEGLQTYLTYQKRQ